MSQADFNTWIADQLVQHAAELPLLPPYATFYLPQTDGGLYDPEQDPLPPDPTVPSTYPTPSG